MLTTNYYKSQDSGYLWRRGEGVTGAGSMKKLLEGLAKLSLLTFVVLTFI